MPIPSFSHMTFGFFLFASTHAPVAQASQAQKSKIIHNENEASVSNIGQKEFYRGIIQALNRQQHQRLKAWKKNFPRFFTRLKATEQTVINAELAKADRNYQKSEALYQQAWVSIHKNNPIIDTLNRFRIGLSYAHVAMMTQKKESCATAVRVLKSIYEETPTEHHTVWRRLLSRSLQCSGKVDEARRLLAAEIQKPFKSENIEEMAFYISDITALYLERGLYNQALIQSDSFWKKVQTLLEEEVFIQRQDLETVLNGIVSSLRIWKRHPHVRAIVFYRTIEQFLSFLEGRFKSIVLDIDSKKKTSQVYFLLGEVYSINQMHTKSARCYEKAALSFPQFYSFYKASDAYLQRGAYHHALKLNSFANPVSSQIASNQYQPWLYQRIHILFELRRYQEIISLMTKNPIASEMTPMTLYHLAYSYYISNQPSRSLQLIDTIFSKPSLSTELSQAAHTIADAIETSHVHH